MKRLRILQNSMKTSRIERKVFKVSYGKLILLLLSISLSLFILEVAARGIDPVLYKKGKMIILTDNSIFALKPGYSMKFETGEYVSDIKINSKGIRDYEYGYYKEKGTKRIGMLGDSFIAAYEVELNRSVAKLLQDKLGSGSESEYEVLNFGQPAVGPTHEAVLLEKEAIKYHPDIVILNLYVGNDFIKIDFGVSGSISESLFDDYDDLGEFGFNVTKTQELKNFMFRNYYTYSFLTRLLNRFRQQEGNDPVFIEAAIYSRKYSQDINSNLEKLESILRHLRRYADKKGIKLLIVLVPAKEQVDEGKLLELVKKYKFNKSDMDIDKGQRLLLNMGRRINVTMLDMLPQFRNKNRNNSLYFDYDAHWNEKGHELAAELIYNKLLKEGYLEK